MLDFIAYTLGITIGATPLVIELQDSMSGEKLVRAAERRKAETSGLRESNPVGNLSEIKRDAQRWARSLRQSLDELHEVQQVYMAGIYFAD